MTGKVSQGLCVPLITVDGGRNAYVEQLVEQYSIPVVTDPGQYRWVLKFEQDVLSLVEVDRPRLKSLSIDLVGMRRRFKSLPISKRGPLARALGRKTETVIDATAGWGQDMMLAALMGYDVSAVERSPVIGVLLTDGVRRYRECRDAGGCPAVTVCDARSYLLDHSADCIYLDPMFSPCRKGSSLTRRPIRVLRELVGNDNDRSELFECALRAAGKRVVTKRPPYVDAWDVPNHTFSGKLMCYDVYLKN